MAKILQERTYSITCNCACVFSLSMIWDVTAGLNKPMKIYSFSPTKCPGCEDPVTIKLGNCGNHE